MPKLSVIIPVYNVEDYIAKCLDSVVEPGRQRLAAGREPGYEVIIVNDGTQDRSAEIAEGYVRECPGFVRLISIENSGQGQARNVGIDAAAGEFLYFIDSDDYLIPGGMEELLALTEQDFDICIFDSIAVNTEGRELKYMAGCKRRETLSLEEYPELLLEGPLVGNSIYRRWLFTETGIRFPSRVWFEDLRTIQKLYAFTNSIVYCPKALHRYLQRVNSVTNTVNTRRNLEIIPAVDDLLDFYKAQGRYEQLRDVLEYMAFHCEFLTSSVRVNLADWKSPVQEELMRDFLQKFPNYRENPYVKNMSLQHKLLDHLLRRRMRGSVHLLMTLNNRVKDKKV